MSNEYLDKKSVGWRFGRYRLFRVLRRGSVSTIYYGEHIRLGHKVALKLLNNWAAPEEQVKKFYTEACLHASLKHENILRVHDFGMKGKIPFMVMDYAPNGTLQDYFEPGVPLEPQTILPLVLNIANALQYVHQRNIIHRDIKPQNILLGRADEVWLSDFGIALAIQPWSSPFHQEAIGTALYVAPEQIEGHPLMASDQYSLAVLVYSWLCGRSPFVGTSVQLCKQHLSQEPIPLREIIPSLTPRIEQIVLQALAKDPYRRFARVLDFANALKLAVVQEDGYVREPIASLLGTLQARPAFYPTR